MSAKRVLLVDDDDLIREVATNCIELNEPWVVTQAGSGQEALALARQQPPDAILLDVMMPEWDGPETLAQLRQIAQLKHVPVILLTAKAGRSEQRRYAELAISGIIAKPFEPMQLTTRIAEILGWGD